MKRVEFVKGWETGGTDNGGPECGPGKAYPLEVTLEQLAEIVYRVRDAWFTSGTVTYDNFGTPDTISIANPPAVGDARVYSETLTGSTTINARGLFAEAAAVGAAFTDYFETTYTPTHSAPAVRDVSDDERAIWLFDPLVTAGTNALEGQDFSDPIEWGTGFAHYLYNNGDPTVLGEYGFNDPSIAFTPSLRLSTPLGVAWFGGEVITDPATRLFLKISLQIYSATNEAVSTIDTGGTESGQLTIQLSGEPISCPLYITSWGASISATVTADFVITATEWWPYSAGNPPAPVWDSTDGSPA